MNDQKNLKFRVVKNMEVSILALSVVGCLVSIMYCKTNNDL